MALVAVGPGKEKGPDVVGLPWPVAMQWRKCPHIWVGVGPDRHCLGFIQRTGGRAEGSWPGDVRPTSTSDSVQGQGSSLTRQGYLVGQWSVPVGAWLPSSAHSGVSPLHPQHISSCRIACPFCPVPLSSDPSPPSHLLLVCFSAQLVVSLEETLILGPLMARQGPVRWAEMLVAYLMGPRHLLAF